MAGTFTAVQPVSWEAKLAEAKKLFDKAREIAEDPEKAPAEERAKLTEYVQEGKRLQAEAVQLKDILAASREIAEDIPAEDTKAKRGDSPASKFATLGEVYVAVAKAAMPDRFGAPDKRLVWFEDEKSGSERKDMAENVGASGGYLVPTEFQTTLRSVAPQDAIVRPLATVIPMRRRQLNLPVLDQSGTTEGIPHWFGGLRFYWEEEAGLKTESDAKFRRISLVAHKLIGYTRSSDELLDDEAVGLDAFLNGPLGFAGGATWMEDYAFLRGNGAGQPLGVINAGATVQIGRATAGQITYVDLINMLAALLPSSRAQWVASQTALAPLMQMTGPSGGSAMYLWPAVFQSGITEGTPARLLGYPIRFTEKLPGIGHTGDILLADFSYYLIGDRQATTIESTRFDRWQYDQTSWRMVHRVDGQPWLAAPLTYADGVSAVSPFVVLAGGAIS